MQSECKFGLESPTAPSIAVGRAKIHSIDVEFSTVQWRANGPTTTTTTTPFDWILVVVVVSV